MRDWKKMERADGNSVYLDDAREIIEKKFKGYNRIVLTLQGLFDRSEVFHPHPPIKLWKTKNCKAFIRFVYDKTRALSGGEKPDFRAYQAKLNASIRTGTITVGQEVYWEECEAEKENARRNRSSYSRRVSTLKRWAPYGNPGPGLVAGVHEFHKRKKTCTYRWERDRRTYMYRRWGKYKEGPVACWLRTVPLDKVLNVDAYQRGDYKQFYEDPRTRAEYLQWAPLLLTAEDFKAGKLSVGKGSAE